MDKETEYMMLLLEKIRRKDCNCSLGCPLDCLFYCELNGNSDCALDKHVNDISKKYITAETVENAIMFIPSEAIYMYVCGNCSEMIEFSHKKHVLITCPTTLIGVVFTLVNLTKDFNRNKHIKTLEKDIVGMYNDAKRLVERLDVMDKTINRLQTSSKDVRTSSEKICGRIMKIHDGYEPEEEK